MESLSKKRNSILRNDAFDDAGCVYWAWGNSGQQVIIKLLPNGQVPVENEVQTPSVNRIIANPNPMKDHVNIKIAYDDPMIRNDSIDIFNLPVLDLSF